MPEYMVWESDILLMNILCCDRDGYKHIQLNKNPQKPISWEIALYTKNHNKQNSENKTFIFSGVFNVWSTELYETVRAV